MSTRFDRRRLGRTVLQGVTLGALATVGVFVFTLHPETWTLLGQASKPFLIALLLLPAGAWMANALRVMVLTRALGHRLGFGNCLSIALCSEFGVAATPGGVGGFVFRLGLLRKHGVPLGQGTSILATDTVQDLAYAAAIGLAVVGYLLFHPELAALFPPGSLTALGVGATVIFAIGAGLWWVAVSGFARRRVEAFCRRSPRLRAAQGAARVRLLSWRANRGLRQAGSSLRFLLRSSRAALWQSTALAFLQWTCRYGVLPGLLLVFGLAQNPVPLFALQGLLFALSAAIMLPGGGGSVEVAGALALHPFVPLALIGVILLLWRFYTFHLALLCGGAVFLWQLRDGGIPRTGPGDPPSARP
ncbi:MAG: UPF0104 family protein [Puniceicoccaceae bacterium]|nr:MAG: UPF0104 family protein [Puniceicoccaceae bacterium]